MKRRAAFAALGLAVLTACSAPEPGVSRDAWDPHETTNRKVHAFNKGLDTSVLRPVARGYVAVVPTPVRGNISSLADTVGTPKSIVNQVLQGDLKAAGRNTARLVINLTAGIGGLGDAAAEVGLPSDPSDFGETLAVWGVREGAYREAPLFGPTTERASAGRIVDFFLNPLNGLSASEQQIATGLRIANGIGQRGEFTDTIDSVLYESADSYTQSRLIYLQNRRFALGETVPEAEEIDPMALDTEGF